MEIIDVGDVHDGQIVVGKVVKPHGIKGELKVYPISGRPDDFLGYPQLILAGPDHGPVRPYAVEQTRIMGSLVILQLAGLSDRNMAESLRGLEVRIARELLPAPGPGTFYWHELAGLPVITDDGQALGRITSLLATSAHDILVINGENGEYLIPFIAQCVPGLAPDGKALIVTPPPGLLEMNAPGVSGRAG